MCRVVITNDRTWLSVMLPLTVGLLKTATRVRAVLVVAREERERENVWKTGNVQGGHYTGDRRSAEAQAEHEKKGQALHGVLVK